MPFYNPSNWKLVQEIQDRKEEIIKEFNRCVELKLIKEKFNATTSFDTKLYKGYVGFLGLKMDTKLWSPEEKEVYTRSEENRPRFPVDDSIISKYPRIKQYFQTLPMQFDENRSQCPVADSIISKYPQIRQYFWNTLPGKGEIRPHYGVNGKIWNTTPDHARIQFCWEPGEDCYFYLEEECIKYEKDLCFGFHDGMDLHWVKNYGNKLRTVLILDLWKDQCEEIQWGDDRSIKGKFAF